MLLPRFTPRSRVDMAEMRDWLGEIQPELADRMADEIIDRIAALESFPDMGAPRPELGPRIRCLIGQPFLVYYRRDRTAIVILRVLHHARRVTRRLLRQN